MLPGQIVAGDPGYDGEDSWQDVADTVVLKAAGCAGASGFPPMEDKEERGAVEGVEKLGAEERDKKLYNERRKGYLESRITSLIPCCAV